MTRFEGIETKKTSFNVSLFKLNWNNDPIWGDWDINDKFKFCHFRIETMTRFEGIETKGQKKRLSPLWDYWNNDPIWGDWDPQLQLQLLIILKLKQWPDLRGLRPSTTTPFFNCSLLKQWPDLRGLRLNLNKYFVFYRIYLLKQWPDLRGLRPATPFTLW